MLLMLKFGFFRQDFSWGLKTAQRELAIGEGGFLAKKTEF